MSSMILDDDAVDRMLRHAESKRINTSQILAGPSASAAVVCGAGTRGMGEYAPAMLQHAKDRALFQYLSDAETRRKEARAREAARKAQKRTPADIAEENRLAREAALQRTREAAERARAVNAQRHAEGLAVAQSRRAEEQRALEELRVERARAREASHAAHRELLAEREHERLERQQKDAELAARRASEHAEEERANKARADALRDKARRARDEAREAVASLKQRQREQADAEAQRLRRLLEERKAREEEERVQNHEAIQKERSGHRSRMHAVGDTRAEQLQDCRSFAKTPVPTADAIAAARESRVEKVREAIRTNRAASTQPSPRRSVRRRR